MSDMATKTNTSTLRQKFDKAVDFVHSCEAGEQEIPQEKKVALDVIHRQATGTPEQTSPFFDPHKTEIWRTVKNLTKDEAMKKYIDTALELWKSAGSPQGDALERQLGTCETSSQTPSGKLLIYADMLSQPCRSVILFCIQTKIPYEVKSVQISKGQQRDEEYRKLNPFGKVPTVVDSDGLILYESHTIMRYLADKYKAADHWYPKDLKERVLVERYLDWHHSGLRRACTTLFFLVYLKPFLTGTAGSPRAIEAATKELASTLKLMDTVWLRDSRYLAGEKLTIADLSAVCELTQLKIIDYDLSKYKNLQRWMADIAKLEGFDAVHEKLEKLVTITQNNKKESDAAAPSSPETTRRTPAASSAAAPKSNHIRNSESNHNSSSQKPISKL